MNRMYGRGFQGRGLQGVQGGQGRGGVKPKVAIWTKSYRPEDLQNIRHIHFFIHERYENDPYLKYQLSTLISYFRTLLSHIYDSTTVQFNTTHQITQSFDTLYILLNHVELHNFLPMLPPIFILLNTLDFHNNSFLFPQNILLYSKAYRIIDTKYINLQYYIPEVKSYTYYLPIILQKETQSESNVKETNDILFMINQGARSMAFYKLIAKELDEEKKYSFQLYDYADGDELFYESKVIVRIYDDLNAHYDNLLFGKCVQMKKVCISEKCADIYHENYYFDKVIFENKLNIYNPSTITQFINKIKLYVNDTEKRKALQDCMQKENYEKNILQCKLIFGK